MSISLDKLYLRSPYFKEEHKEVSLNPPKMRPVTIDLRL